MINKRLLNTSAFLLFIWIVWSQYSQNVRLEAMEEKKVHMTTAPVGNAKYTITIDPKKKVEEYTWVEWLIYKLYMRGQDENAEHGGRQLIEPSKQEQTIPPKSRIIYNCKPTIETLMPHWCGNNKEALMGSGILPDSIEQGISQARVGQEIRVGLPYSEVFGKQGDVGQMLFFDMKVEKIADNTGNINTNTSASK